MSPIAKGIWRAVFGIATVVALIYLIAQTHWLLIVLPIAWGGYVGTGMQLGMESATKEQRSRKSSRFENIWGPIVLMLFLFGPCLLIAWLVGLFPTLAACWMVMVGLTLAVLFFKLYRGGIGRLSDET